MFDARFFYFFHRTEVLEQSFAPLLADPRDAVQLGSDHRLRPYLAVEGNREAMHLLLDALQQIELLAVPRDRHDLRRVAGHELRSAVPLVLDQTAHGDGESEFILQD